MNRKRAQRTNPAIRRSSTSSDPSSQQMRAAHDAMPRLVAELLGWRIPPSRSYD
ncbi:MAG: hypothetical protein ACYDGY_09380 [Acidimicrobiales bacterium]